METWIPLTNQCRLNGKDKMLINHFWMWPICLRTINECSFELSWKGFRVVFIFPETVFNLDDIILLCCSMMHFYIIYRRDRIFYSCVSMSKCQNCKRKKLHISFPQKHLNDMSYCVQIEFAKRDKNTRTTIIGFL